MKTDQKEEKKEIIDSRYQVILKIYRGKSSDEIDRYTKIEEVITVFRRLDYRYLILESGKIIRRPYGQPPMVRLDYLLDSDITSKPFYVSARSFRDYPEPHLQLKAYGACMVNGLRTDEELTINIVCLNVIPE